MCGIFGLFVFLLSPCYQLQLCACFVLFLSLTLFAVCSPNPADGTDAAAFHRQVQVPGAEQQAAGARHPCGRAATAGVPRVSASIFPTLSPARLAGQRHRDDVFLRKAACAAALQCGCHVLLAVHCVGEHSQLLRLTDLFCLHSAWHRRSGPAIACKCRYDSAGVCIDGAARAFVIVKATGKVDCLEDLANEQINNGGAGFPGDEVGARVAIPALRTELCSHICCFAQQQLCVQ